MPTDRQLAILLIGDARRGEMREACEAIARVGRAAHAPDVDAALALLAEDRIVPDAVILAQAYPGQFAAEAVERLRRAAPVARLMAMLGSWCEGESRSGAPAPGVIRLYWHQWLARGERPWARAPGGFPSPWSLPATATDEERLLVGPFDTTTTRRGAVVVCAAGRDMRDWLAEACRRRGYATVAIRPGESIRVDAAQAAVFDATDAGPEEIAQIRRLAAGVKHAPIIVLASFPRIEDHRRARSAGASAVLSKPLLLDDLYGHLDQADQREAGPAR